MGLVTDLSSCFAAFFFFLHILHVHVVGWTRDTLSYILPILKFDSAVYSNYGWDTEPGLVVPL